MERNTSPDKSVDDRCTEIKSAENIPSRREGRDGGLG